MEKKKEKILVIDDDTAVLNCIKLSLQDLGHYSITVCDDPKQALQILQTQDFATVISDVNMPVISGLDILKEVKFIDE